MANSRFRSDYIAEKNKRYAQIRMTDDTFNLNQSTSWVEIPMNGNVDKMDKGFVASGNGIKAQFTDWATFEASVYLESSVARPNVEIAFALNGVVRPVIGACSYIRNANSHNHSSSNVVDGFMVSTNDVITLMCRQEANNGTVTSPASSSIMRASSTPAIIEKGPAGTYSEGFETNLGHWSNVGTASWTRQTGATPSSGTGTAGANNGAYYVYTEVSSGANTETFTLSTHYFNYLRSVDFYYQLEGSDCGTLELQYKDRAGTWVTKWSISGNQGSSYINVTEDFSGVTDVDYINEIRFKYSGATDYQGDCCIDDVSIVSV